MSQVPNGSVYSCNTCHSAVPSLNDFGLDVQATLAGGPSWSAVWDLDSDGDGQTNGQELGDPCGDWTVGATPARTTDISNPGEAASTSADPNNPTCGGEGGAGGSTSSGVGGSTSSGVGGEGGSTSSGVGGSSSGVGGSSSGVGGSSSGTAPPADTGDDSGCSVSSHRPSSSTAAFALLALGLLIGRRRRS